MSFLIPDAEIADIQAQVAPQLGDDICQVWRMPGSALNATVAGGSGVDRFGARITTGTNTARPDQQAVLAGTYFCRKNHNASGQEMSFGGQIVGVSPWIIALNAADKPDIRGADWLMFMAKREELMQLAEPGWRANHAYLTGASEQPQIANGHYYRALNDGLSGSSEPAWPARAGASVQDAGLEWLCIGRRLRLEVTDPGGSDTISVERIVEAKDVSQ